MLKRLFSKQSSLPIRVDLHTDSGMLGIWNMETFEHINDYDSWDKELCEDKDIIGHIESGTFVPIDLGDGVFSVDVRIGTPEDMSDREREYLLVPSKPYLLKSSGQVAVSGIEFISGEKSSKYTSFHLDSGDYSVFLNLIDWNQEPGALDESGKPTKNSLPDLIIFISKQEEKEYRKEIQTFDKNDSLR